MAIPQNTGIANKKNKSSFFKLLKNIYITTSSSIPLLPLLVFCSSIIFWKAFSRQYIASGISFRENELLDCHSPFLSLYLRCTVAFSMSTSLPFFAVTLFSHNATDTCPALNLHNGFFPVIFYFSELPDLVSVCSTPGKPTFFYRGILT